MLDADAFLLLSPLEVVVDTKGDGRRGVSDFACLEDILCRISHLQGILVEQVVCSQRYCPVVMEE